MATTYKVLGQSKPSAATNTTLYTVPASTAAVISTLAICNDSASAVEQVLEFCIRLLPLVPEMLSLLVAVLLPVAVTAFILLRPPATLRLISL